MTAAVAEKSPTPIAKNLTGPGATQALLAALVQAQKLARGVEKGSTNLFHKYNYAGTEAIILEAKDAMAATGLALLPRGARTVQLGTRWENDSKGTPHELPQLFIARRWTLVHEGGGMLELEEQVWPVVPDKGRPLDKAVAAADTAALGYLLRNVLMMARVEKGTDLDDGSRDGGRKDDSGEGPAVGGGTPEMTDRQRADIKAELLRLRVPSTEWGSFVGGLVGHDGTITVVEANDALTKLRQRQAPNEALGADSKRPH